MMAVQERSCSEPPDSVEVNQKTGLRGGFPIKINGFALGSQENLNDLNESNGFPLHSRFGSGSIPTKGSTPSRERRRSLRGTTPVKIGGVEFVRSPSPTSDACSTPFGPVSGKRNMPGKSGNRRMFTPANSQKLQQSADQFNGMFGQTSDNSVNGGQTKLFDGQGQDSIQRNDFGNIEGTESGNVSVNCRILLDSSGDNLSLPLNHEKTEEQIDRKSEVIEDYYQSIQNGGYHLQESESLYSNQSIQTGGFRLHESESMQSSQSIQNGAYYLQESDSMQSSQSIQNGAYHLHESESMQSSQSIQNGGYQDSESLALGQSAQNGGFHLYDSENGLESGYTGLESSGSYQKESYHKTESTHAEMKSEITQSHITNLSLNQPSQSIQQNSADSPSRSSFGEPTAGGIKLQRPSHFRKLSNCSDGITFGSSFSLNSLGLGGSSTADHTSSMVNSFKKNESSTTMTGTSSAEQVNVKTEIDRSSCSFIDQVNMMSSLGTVDSSTMEHDNRMYSQGTVDSSAGEQGNMMASLGTVDYSTMEQGNIMTSLGTMDSSTREQDNIMSSLASNLEQKMTNINQEEKDLPVINISSNKLEHAISNMTEKLQSFKMEVNDLSRVDQIDQALINMKATLKTLRSEQEQPACNLDDVISNMKATLTSIKSEVNHKTLLELNREMTPFDLPALSPVPQGKRAQKVKTYSVETEMKKDLVNVERIDAVGQAQGRSDYPRAVESTQYDSLVSSQLDPDVREYSVEARVCLNPGDVLPTSTSEDRVAAGEELDNRLYMSESQADRVEHFQSFVSTEQKTADSFSDFSKVEFEQLGLMKNVVDSQARLEHELTSTDKLEYIERREVFQDSPKPRVDTAADNTEQRMESVSDATKLIPDHQQHIIKECLEELECDQQADDRSEVQSYCTAVTETLQETFEDCVVQTLDSSAAILDNLNTRITVVDGSETMIDTDTELVTDSAETDADTVTADTTTRAENERKFAKMLENASKSSIFMTEFSSDNDSYSAYYKFDRETEETRKEKRSRNKTIDLHDLPSLFWEGTVRNYHERQYALTQTSQCQTEDPAEDAEDGGQVDVAKDGLGLILKRLQNIEMKLDELKTIETSILTHDIRRHSLPGRISTMPEDTMNLTNITNLTTDTQDDYCLTRTPTGGDLEDQEEDQVVRESKQSEPGKLDEVSSGCSTPTLLVHSKPQELGYESDDTLYHESDCDVVVDERSDNDDSNPARWTYKPFGLDISELSDYTESEDEDPEARRKRIESLAAAISLKNPQLPVPQVRRAELNMDIDTLSERSEEECEEERERRPQRSRRPSGRKRSMSRERNVAKIRYCWRCHHAGHENWQCQEDVQPGGWCPRCLESSHWEDACWVESAGVMCPICSIPGHLPCVHQATDFRQRKLVIDTFGWLAFKEWFQDLTFRSWWNCSGFTGVPLYKIMQRNPGQDLDLGFES